MPLPYLVAGVVASLALVAAGQTWRLQSLQAEVKADRAAQIENALLRERAARVAQAALNTQARKAADAYLDRARAARTAAAGTDAAYLGLLNAINAAGGSTDDPSAACRADAERVRRLEGLLAEGAGLAAEGASRVGKLDAQVSGLQGFAEALSVPFQ